MFVCTTTTSSSSFVTPTSSLTLCRVRFKLFIQTRISSRSSSLHHHDLLITARVSVVVVDVTFTIVQGDYCVLPPKHLRRKNAAVSYQVSPLPPLLPSSSSSLLCYCSAVFCDRVFQSRVRVCICIRILVIQLICLHTFRVSLFLFVYSSVYDCGPAV